MTKSAQELVELPAPWRDAAVTVVLPTYNESANLPIIVEALLALPLPNLNLVVVDDNSPDGTGKIAEELAATSGGRVCVVHRAGKKGLGRAYVDGMTRALDGGAEYIVQMDADLSHRPEYIPQMLGTLLSTHAGVVIGSRYVSGGSLAKEWGLNRRLLSGWANFYVDAVLRMRIRDVTAGYKLWARQTLLDIGLDRIRSNGYSFQVEMNYLAAQRGHKIVEIPIHFEDRQIGSSKMTLAVKLESAKLPFQLRWRHRGGR
ncbi:MAG: polyprenol monophosphomannose synthase [Micromonosporaceae bacterium]